jgi:hypothetical protein
VPCGNDADWNWVVAVWERVKLIALSLLISTLLCGSLAAITWFLLGK